MHENFQSYPFHQLFVNLYLYIFVGGSKALCLAGFNGSNITFLPSNITFLPCKISVIHYCMLHNIKCTIIMSLVKFTEVIKSKTPKAYKNKKLNNANFGDFNHTDYQVFLHLVSKIGGVDKVGKYLQAE